MAILCKYIITLMHYSSDICIYDSFNCTLIYIYVYHTLLVIRDSTSTTMFMLGAVFGEGMLPMVMGLVIAYCGPAGFPVGIVVSSLVLVLIYIALDVVGGSHINSSSSSGSSSLSISSSGRSRRSGVDDAVPGVLYHSVMMNTLNDKQYSDIELTD